MTHDIDPNTDGCIACGATDYEIVDNIYPTCEPVTGPHRLAIIAIRREQKQAEHRALWAKRRAQEAEDFVVHHLRAAAEAEANAEALAKSAELLRADSESDRLSLGAAIRRL